jgi:hypothetical protein
MASGFEVVYLQALHVSASLASPAVTLQHLAMQLTIAALIESDSRAFEPDLRH